MPIYEKLMGNPFVDAGVCGICEWLGRTVQPEQITTADLQKVVEEFIPMAAKWEKWNSIFTRNHKLSNGKKDKRESNFRELLLDYIAKTEELGQAGNCIGCGRRDADANSPLVRTGVPLTGGKNNNFFPAFSEGADYCAACALAIQFIPFALVATGKKGARFLMLHSNSWDMLRSWTTICIKGVERQYSQQAVPGCFNPGYSNPRNGLFYMIQEMLIESEEMQIDEDKDISMQIYSFTNNNQHPNLEIFYIPSSVFMFLCSANQNPFKDAWTQIVKKGYGRVNWNKFKSKKHKNKNNLVYEYLLHDRSIRGFFLNRQDQKSIGNWELFSLYLRKVRNMKQERLDTIKQVGDRIAESISKSGKRGRQRLQDFAGAQTYNECRNALMRIIEDRIERKEQNPLFSLDDCVEHLFISSDNDTTCPDELDELDDEQKDNLLHFASDSFTFWRETRDLLLFRIYEQLHDWLIK